VRGAFELNPSVQTAQATLPAAGASVAAWEASCGDRCGRSGVTDLLRSEELARKRFDAAAHRAEAYRATPSGSGRISQGRESAPLRRTER
jgi:hypothetical protein